MKAARASAGTKRDISALRLDLSVPEHALIYSAHQQVTRTARAEWVRLTLLAGIAARQKLFGSVEYGDGDDVVTSRSAGQRVAKPAPAASRMAGAFSSGA